MNSSKREPLSETELAYINSITTQYLSLNTFHFGKPPRKVMQYDKRPNMYGGDGAVYLLQMFSSEELVNNRIGAYMILPTSQDSVGFHTHGPRKEQELYVVMEGHGEYLEKAHEDDTEKSFSIQKGNITTVRGQGFHAIKNIGNTPLIIFVITTNE